MCLQLGPTDNGKVVEGPGPLTQQALVEGVEKGRNGKGSIFVWAAGNGGIFQDTCSCDGYVSSIYTISITSLSQGNEKPQYTELCSGILAATYSSGAQSINELAVTTTDINHKCTKLQSGTSASAPLAAGIIALTLEANSNLTWRDIMFIIVLSSRPIAISTNYTRNNRGLIVSNTYGFGLMDAGRMVQLAKNWTNVPEMIVCSSKSRIEP